MVAQPIFQAGRLDAEVDAAEAREQQALADYQGAIQNAFREVRSALAAQSRARESFDAEGARAAALAAALGSRACATSNGLASQLDVIDAERSLLAARDRAPGRAALAARGGGRPVQGAGWLKRIRTWWKIEDLHFAYGELPILRGLSLKIPRGKVVAILGGSGSGKSTLLKLIGGQLAPARGWRPRRRQGGARARHRTSCTRCAARWA